MKEVAGLEVIQRLNPNSKTHVVIFHGYGANSNDLASLQQALDPQNKFNWHFPNGFLKLDMMGGFDSRAWFPIDIQAYEQARAQGRYRDMANHRPPGLDEARDRLLKFVKVILEDSDQLILGGFSQGSMLTMELSHYLKDVLKAVIILSGAILDEVTWFPKIEELGGLPFIQSHGVQDPVLSFQEAERLSEKLISSHWKGQFHSFQGGHEIPLQVLMQVKQFMNNLNLK